MSVKNLFSWWCVRDFVFCGTVVLALKTTVDACTTVINLTRVRVARMWLRQ